MSNYLWYLTKVSLKLRKLDTKMILYCYDSLYKVNILIDFEYKHVNRTNHLLKSYILRSYSLKKQTKITFSEISLLLNTVITSIYPESWQKQNRLVF